MAAPLANPHGCCGEECCVCDPDVARSIRCQSPCHGIDQTNPGITCNGQNQLVTSFSGFCGSTPNGIGISIACDPESQKPRLNCSFFLGLTCVGTNSVLADAWSCAPLHIEFGVDVGCCCAGGTGSAVITVTE